MPLVINNLLIMYAHLFHFLSLLTKYILVAFASILQKLNQA
jgi:hypothetical protein